MNSNPLNLRKFWSAIEAIPGQAAVLGEWRHHLGAEMALSKRLLRKTDATTNVVPHDVGSGPLRVLHVVRDRHGITGVSDDNEVEVTLSEEDLVIYKVYWERLVRLIREAMGANGRDGNVPGLHGLRLVGTLKGRSGDVSVYLLLCADSQQRQDQLQAMLAFDTRPFVLLTPSGISDVHLAARLRQHPVLQVVLMDQLHADGKGGLVLASEVSEALQRFVERASVEPISRVQAGPPYRFERAKQAWHLAFDGQTATLPAQRGLEYIYFLLSAPHMPIPCTRLISLADDRVEIRDGVGSTTVSKEDFKEMKKRLVEIDQYLEKFSNDHLAVEELEAERDQLTDEVLKSRGLGGKPRWFTDRNERARLSVKRAIERAIRSITDPLPPMASHLAAINTGSNCCYEPREPIAWSLRRF